MLSELDHLVSVLQMKQSAVRATFGPFWETSRKERRSDSAEAVFSA